jgi:serine/threonine protein kinase/Tol biopolymer transport system component
MVYEPFSKLSETRLPILPGTCLGPYEILSSIGAGGMGEVYQAHDTKLGRDVAIKVLPANFVNDPQRLARFQREARLLAALNHPSIATIYGLEQSGGVTCLVMELVPGETLADRVKSGPLPVEEALQLAVQLAEALEAAHEKSIIHRDLKPTNVKVTPEGKVKVLDFGLAKAFAGDAENVDPSNSPTLSATVTMQGVILGTAAYMSPEQARGKTCDKRADIWAFGCVLYELLSGKHTFRGETVTEILASVLKEEPDWRALPDSTPLKIRDLLGRCLQKELRHRLHDAADARIEIEVALTTPSVAEPAAAAKGIRILGRRQLLFGVGALLFVAVISSLVTWNLMSSRPRPVSRTVITLPPGQQLAGLDSGPSVALTRDGTNLAYVASQGGAQQLYLREMDTLDAKPIPGTEGAVNPFFSPDGQWVGFFAGGKLKKISVSGGAALAIGDATYPYGANWGSRGMIAFVPSNGSGLQQVSDEGGTPRPLTHLEKGELSHLWPEFLPGGKAVLFAAGSTAINFTNARVAVQSVGSGERRNLIQVGTNPRYAASGHLVYAQGGSLMAVPFDPKGLAVTGTAVSMVEGVLQSPVSGAAQYSFSTTGSLVYVPGAVQSNQSKLVWVSRNGAEQPLPAPARVYRGPRVSPEGRRIAVTIQEQESQIWLYDLSRETLTRLTFGGNVNNNPSWTPDGKRIAFESSKEGPLNIFWQFADGTGGLERLTTSEYNQVPHSWSPDGQLLAFIEITPATGYDIWMLRVGDASSPGSGQVRKAQPFLRTRFDEAVPRFSPDGRWLAYVSNESGHNEIYVQPYPGPGGKWQISTEGGREPVWNRNGRELFYRSGDKMMAVEITAQPSFIVGKPRMLFEGRYRPTPATSPNYDVSPDGQRFLMLKPVEQAQSTPTQINVVLNWFEELKRRVPTVTR